MKLGSKSIFLILLFGFSMIILLPVYGQEVITTNSITDLIKTTTEKLKNMASESCK